MQVTIDGAGRLVIPKEIREQTGIAPGMPLDIRVENGVIEIEPQYARVRFEKQGRFTVAVPLDDGPPLDNDVVNRTLRQLRRERDQKLLGGSDGTALSD